MTETKVDRGGWQSGAVGCTNTLDAANLDRISVIVTDYENEEEILTRRGFNKDNAYLIVSWARSMREKVEKEMMRVTISNRVIGFIAETVEWDGLSFEQALEEEFFMQIDPSDATLLRPKATFGARKFGS